MFTKTQIVVLALWLGGPLALLLLFMLINPSYEAYLFQKANGGYGMTIVLWVEIIHAIILCLGFLRINMGHSARTTQGRKSSPNRHVATLSTLTFILFTIPTLCMVVLYPSIVILMRSKAPN